MSEQNQPALHEVQAAFAHWRASGWPRRTPPALRAQAVSLLARHSVSEVMTALRVDHRRLSRWRRELSTDDAAATAGAFIELPAVALAEPAVVPASAWLTLTRQRADGEAVSIQGELSAGQWRWALALLRKAMP